MRAIFGVVFTNAKILILKLITTLCDEVTTEIVVFTNAKILILKLITTFTASIAKFTALYLPMQRY